MQTQNTHSIVIGYICWIFGFTGGLFLVGLLYDLWTLNEQVSEINGAS